MSRKDPVIKTKRLTIHPMDDEAIALLIERTSDDELKQAYTDMLAGCKKNPEKRIWYAPWQISLKKDGSFVGDLCFKGPAVDKTVEIGYGILSDYQNRGFMTEACAAVIDWAFINEDLDYIEAETDQDNVASKRVLEKLEFLPTGCMGEEGPRFYKEKPQTVWLPIFMCFGVSIGSSVGALAHDVPIGMLLGIAIGIAVGFLVDRANKKKPKKYKGVEKEE